MGRGTSSAQEMNMKRHQYKFLSDDRGVTSIEYALAASLIAVVVVAALVALSDVVKSDFDTVGTCLSAPSAKNCPN